MSELRDEDVPGFRNFVRVDPPMFREMLLRLGPRIEKQVTKMRRPLDLGLKLAIKLRYLATGDSYRSLEYNFRVSHITISGIIYDVCEAIFGEYADEVVSCPTTVAEFRPVARMFGDRWQFHHAIGALDGKHVAIQCPKNGGSLYFNYKKFHSKILMALVDADYKFLWVDVGAKGSASDAQVFNDSQLKEVIEDGTMKFPADDALPGDDNPMPYFIIGDDAFALRTWMMKPYSSRHLTDEERIFNYRLSRARRIVENAFGILSHRFRCLLTTMRQAPHRVESIMLACVCIHNLMRMRYP